MIKYTDSKQIKREVDKALIDAGKTKADVARVLGVSRQQVSNTLSRKKLSFDDIAHILDTIDCDLYIDIRPREK